MIGEFQCMTCKNREGRRCKVFGEIPPEYLGTEPACPKRDPIEEPDAADEGEKS